MPDYGEMTGDKICGACPYAARCEYITLTPDLRGESCQYYSLAKRDDMEKEEIQIRQIEENIKGLERRVEVLREKKSADTAAKIFELENILSDLKGHLAWHKRKAEREVGARDP